MSIKNKGVAALGAAVLMASTMISAPAVAAEPEPASGPTRQEINDAIAAAQGRRAAGIVGVVAGAGAIVAGWVSIVNEADEEDERDYNARPGYDDEAEEPNGGPFVACVVVGAALVALGTVGIVTGSKKVRRLEAQRVRLGYDNNAEAVTVGLNFEF